MPAFSTIVIPVGDIDAAKKLYAVALGAEPHTDSPYYVGFNVDGNELGLTPASTGAGELGAIAYVDHPDAQAAVDALVEAGATIVQAPTEVGGGTTIAILADADGNRFGVRSHA